MVATVSTRNVTEVTFRSSNDTVVAAPLFVNAPTATVDVDAPSLKSNVPAVTRSSAFGRSYSFADVTYTGCAHVNVIHDPAFPPAVAHSLV